MLQFFVGAESLGLSPEAAHVAPGRSVMVTPTGLPEAASLNGLSWQTYAKRLEISFGDAGGLSNLSSKKIPPIIARHWWRDQHELTAVTPASATAKSVAA